MFYKDFEKVFVGVSDVASLVFRFCDHVEVVNFGGDSAYYAYLIPEGCRLTNRYEEVASGIWWLSVYDDTHRTLNIHCGPKPIRVYRAGGYGLAIEVPNGATIKREDGDEEIFVAPKVYVCVSDGIHPVWFAETNNVSEFPKECLDYFETAYEDIFRKLENEEDLPWQRPEDEPELKAIFFDSEAVNEWNEAVEAGDYDGFVLDDKLKNADDVLIFDTDKEQNFFDFLKTCDVTISSKVMFLQELVAKHFGFDADEEED
jgi:hypothetical protein